MRFIVIPFLLLCGCVFSAVVRFLVVQCAVKGETPDTGQIDQPASKTNCQDFDDDDVDEHQHDDVC